MSIYGGFSTRQLEGTYYKALYNAIYLLQLKISRNQRNRISSSLTFVEQFDEHRFVHLFTKLYNRLYTMEE